MKQEIGLKQNILNSRIIILREYYMGFDKHSVNFLANQEFGII